jgi:hypothetical protein
MSSFLSLLASLMLSHMIDLCEAYSSTVIYVFLVQLWAKNEQRFSATGVSISFISFTSHRRTWAARLLLGLYVLLNFPFPCFWRHVAPQGATGYLFPEEPHIPTGHNISKCRVAWMSIIYQWAQSHEGIWSACIVLAGTATPACLESTISFFPFSSRFFSFPLPFLDSRYCQYRDRFRYKNKKWMIWCLWFVSLFILSCPNQKLKPNRLTKCGRARSGNAMTVPTPPDDQACPWVGIRCLETSYSLAT